MNPFLKAALEEEQRLLAELQSNPTFQRLEIVRGAIRAYEAFPASPVLDALNVHVAQTHERKPREGSKAAQVIEAAEQFLTRLGHRAPSSEIAAEVRRRGIALAGVKPDAVVASYLSSSDKFDNVKGKGYGLVVWNQSVPPPVPPGEQGESSLTEHKQKTEAASPTVMEIAA